LYVFKRGFFKLRVITLPTVVSVHYKDKANH